MSAAIKVLLSGMGVVGFVSALGWFSYQNMHNAPGPVIIDHQVDQQTALRARGAYLMSIIGCADCHSPRDKDGKFIPGREFSGHPADAPLPEWNPSMLEKNTLFTMAPSGTAFAGPMGVVPAANITPDKDTGIGNLSAEALIKSWRTGKHWKEDRPILPLMPYEFYAAMTDDDIRALHAFLMSMPATKNKVPSAKVNPPPAAPKG